MEREKTVIPKVYDSIIQSTWDGDKGRKNTYTVPRGEVLMLVKGFVVYGGGGTYDRDRYGEGQHCKLVTNKS